MLAVPVMKGGIPPEIAFSINMLPQKCLAKRMQG